MAPLNGRATIVHRLRVVGVVVCCSKEEWLELKHTQDDVATKPWLELWPMDLYIAEHDGLGVNGTRRRGHFKEKDQGATSGLSQAPLTSIELSD